MTKRDRILEQLYNTDSEAYVAMLTEDWTQYDWDMFNKTMNEPIWDEENNVWLDSYYHTYIKKA
jgi:hypothetical protein